ncbi:MAG TPA: hypothetical protein VG271_11785 [Beijerinckiaceae bacterium]|nr:hypothetical protein [Beijerinckiaceae bacterium]
MNTPIDSRWEPKSFYPFDEVLSASEATRALPDFPLKETEDMFRIEALGLLWDIGVFVTEPADPAHAAIGPDGHKTGFLLLHGGSGDFKSMSTLARLLAGKFGHRAVAMTFPGRLYLPDPKRDWPDDTIHADGSVRTPIWVADEFITRDQYDVIQDATMRTRYGMRTLARAKPGSRFFDRMAAWPVAFEEAMLEACRRHFPPADWAIFTHGHSTGGAFSAYITQRVQNIAGQTEIETAPIGFINKAKHDWSGSLGKIGSYGRVATKPAPRADPFNELYIRTWRDLARYRGPEALGQEGPAALMRLPWIMEDVLDSWARAKIRPNFKAEYVVTHEVLPSLEAAARAAAGRLGMNAQATDALVQRYFDYCRYDMSEGAKPIPPILYINSKDSRDNSPEAYNEAVLPAFAKLDPAPTVRATQFGAGTHVYYKADKDFPLGIAPAVARLFNDAIANRYYY